MMAGWLQRAKALSIALQHQCQRYLVTKSPYQIPPAAKEWIVTYGPWIDLAFVVLLAPVLLVLLGVGTFLLPLSVVGGYHLTFRILLALVILIAQLAIMIAALPGLFTRRMQGWELLYYGLLLNLAYNLIQLQILSLILGGAIGAYLLFQIRVYYR